MQKKDLLPIKWNPVCSWMLQTLAETEYLAQILTDLWLYEEHERQMTWWCAICKD